MGNEALTGRSRACEVCGAVASPGEQACRVCGAELGAGVPTGSRPPEDRTNKMSLTELASSVAALSVPPTPTSQPTPQPTPPTTPHSTSTPSIASAPVGSPPVPFTPAGLPARRPRAALDDEALLEAFTRSWESASDERLAADPELAKPFAFIPAPAPTDSGHPPRVDEFLRGIALGRSGRPPAGTEPTDDPSTVIASTNSPSTNGNGAAGGAEPGFLPQPRRSPTLSDPAQPPHPADPPAPPSRPAPAGPSEPIQPPEPMRPPGPIQPPQPARPPEPLRPPEPPTPVPVPAPDPAPPIPTPGPIPPVPTPDPLPPVRPNPPLPSPFPAPPGPVPPPPTMPTGPVGAPLVTAGSTGAAGLGDGVYRGGRYEALDPPTAPIVVPGYRRQTRGGTVYGGESGQPTTANADAPIERSGSLTGLILSRGRSEQEIKRRQRHARRRTALFVSIGVVVFIGAVALIVSVLAGDFIRELYDTLTPNR